MLLKEIGKIIRENAIKLKKKIKPWVSTNQLLNNWALEAGRKK